VRLFDVPCPVPSLSTDPVEANLQLVPDWIDDALVLVANREASFSESTTHLPRARRRRAARQLFTDFTVRDGQLVQLRDHAHRSEALSDRGLDFEWR
jgi:hypothetical protein